MEAQEDPNAEMSLATHSLLAQVNKGKEPEKTDMIVASTFGGDNTALHEAPRKSDSVSMSK